VKHLQKQLNQLQSSLSKTMAADRIVFVRNIRRIRKQIKLGQPGNKLKETIASLKRDINTKIQAKALRLKNVPLAPGLPALPITREQDAIVRAIKNNPVVIISGETGSGKTTQIPKFCLAAGRGVDGLIGCTQPRRIAAITVASRIAEEMGEKPGQSVGYKIRFQDKTRDNAYIKIMTDGILLAETQGDPYLNSYDTIIVDEAHERSLNIDFVLGIFKTLLQKRRDLKLIITSATIDTLKFSAAFDNAPVIEVSGRTYPVATHYLVPKDDLSDNSTATHVDLAVDAVETLIKQEPPGDILVFMPTEQDIRDTCDLLAGRKLKKTNIRPLFARLSAAEQQAVFKTTKFRKIIVATNIAETSLTIPGIRYVVDTGLARVAHYTPKSRITALPVVPISQSSADQRLGRCGRMADGVCIRLFSEDDYRQRPHYTQPEILRSNLAEVILRMLHLKLGDPSRFPFIDSPAEKSIQDGFQLLMELGAIKRRKHVRHHKIPQSKSSTAFKTKVSSAPVQYKLTAIGRLMVKLPIDPRLSRIIIEADNRGCLGEITIIVSALSIQDPRERPLEKEAQADKAHKEFAHPQSDFLSLLNLWHAFRKQTRNNRYMQSLKKFCQSNFLSFKRMREWQDIYHQIATLLTENGFKINREVEPVSYKADTPFSRRYTRIHQSLLSGFLSNIAQKKEKQYFQGARDRQTMIFPGSAIFDTPGQWIVAAELVDTSRLFSRTCANIDVAWLEEFGGEQCQRTYYNPRWSSKKGTVVADEQVTLFGLIIVTGRVVKYGPIDPIESHRIFIMQGLIPGKLNQHFDFLTHNHSLDQSVRDMEHRIRRKDIRVDDKDIFQFYHTRLTGVYDIKGLKKKIAKRGDDAFLKMSITDFMLYDPDPEELASFPDTIPMGQQSFPVQYEFDTSAKNDGMTVTIPVSFTSAITPAQSDWMVPGFLKEKIETLVKSLPKAYRKKLLPLSKTVQVIVDEMPRFSGPLATALSRFIHKRMGVDIPAVVWSEISLPDHLKMRIALTDYEDNILAAGRDLTQLKAQHVSEPDPEILEDARLKWYRPDIDTWDFGDLPDTITVGPKPECSWILFPGLQLENQSLCINLFKDRGEAEKSHCQGVAHLFHKYLAKELKHLKKNLQIAKTYHRAATHFGGVTEVEKQVYQQVTTDLFQKNIRTQSQFFDTLEKLTQKGIHRLGQKLLLAVGPILESIDTTQAKLKQLALSNLNNTNIMDFLTRLENQRTRLVPQNFIRLYSLDQMTHIPRYIKAIQIRAQRGVVNFEKDQLRQETLTIYTDQLNKLIQQLTPDTTEEKRQAIENLFWLLEEYHVSLFAQELKTAVRVSEAKIKKAIQAIERMI
jgi:ATP-dependent helicase HrpA